MTDHSQNNFVTLKILLIPSVIWFLHFKILNFKHTHQMQQISLAGQEKKFEIQFFSEPVHFQFSVAAIKFYFEYYQQACNGKMPAK